MIRVQITKSMLDQLEYDTQKMSLQTGNITHITVGSADQLVKPTAMFVFAGSDLNAAAYNLAKSLETPFANGAVASVFLQESIRDDFVAKLEPNLPTYGIEVKEHQGHKRALETVLKLNARTIANSPTSATLVCDLTHEQLGTGATGVVTLHTFRTAKEAASLASKESLKFSNASIWHVDYACAYELVAAVGCQHFFINCYRVSLEPIIQHFMNGESFVTVDKAYHYETLPYNGTNKTIVFPIGTIFAN